MSDQDLTLDEKKFLLRLARQTIEQYAADQKTQAGPDDTELGDILKSTRGAFVTLHKRGNLRGCIGTFEGQGRLVDTIQTMAVSAGWQDPRFPSLTEDEIAQLDIEISVLSPLRKTDDVNEIEVGKHGIYITKDYHRGVLLPQVAVEYGWDRQTFLEQTCIKAGLPKQAWKKDVVIEIFSADVFGEKDSP